MRRIIATFVFVLLFTPLTIFPQGWDDHINVHFYPQTLVPRDILTDGPDGRAIRITADTFLVWVDLAPEMFFEHETCYILISKNRIRIKKGRWWPVLNRKRLFKDGQGQYAIVSPYKMPGRLDNPPTGEEIAVHVYPHELTSRDRLQDGPLERLFRIHSNSLLIWVDRLPGAFFAHPTAYILISKQNVRVEEGIWWPELNGRKILYGQSNRVGVISPFKVSKIR